MSKGASADSIAAPELRVCLLGHTRLEVDGQPIALAAQRRALPLLGYLLLNRGAVLERAHVAYLLWPDEEEEVARTRLRPSLHELVRALPPAAEPWINTDGTTLSWNPKARTRVDLEEFDAALAAGRLHEAVALYGGDLLAGCYDEWAIAPRERLRAKYIRALDTLGANARRDFEFAAAVDFAQRLLEVDPLREDIVRRLMSVHFEAGDRSGALAAYAKFAAHIRVELGVEPMPETVALRDAIAGGGPATGSGDPGDGAESADAAPLAHAGLGTLPFAARERDLGILRDAWTQARRRRGGLVFLGGVAGIGKSRLAAEFAREVTDGGGRALIGPTASPEAGPYQCIVEALRGALPLVAAQPLGEPWMGALATLFPELHARLEIAAPPALTPEAERLRLYEALTRTLLGVARVRPTLLVLEDLHWAGDATIDLLTLLARRTALSSLLIIVTYRDDEVAGAPVGALFTAQPNARRIMLAPFSSAETAALAERLGRSDSATLERLSGGNPLFLSQLVAGGTALDTAVVSIREYLAARIAGLSSEALAIARTAALFGARFARGALCAATGWSDADVSTALAELIERRFVRESADGTPFDHSFVHQTVCDVVEAGIDPEDAPLRHLRIARVLESYFPSERDRLAAEIARHLELAGARDLAAEKYVAAGTAALRVGAAADGSEFAQRAIALEPPAAVLAEAYFLQLQSAQFGQQPKLVRAALDGLKALGERTGDLDFIRRVSLLRARYFMLSGVSEERSAAVQGLRDVAGADPTLLAWADLCQAMIHTRSGEIARAGELCASAAKHARASGDRDVLVLALARGSQSLARAGQRVAALQLLDEAAALGERPLDQSLANEVALEISGVLLFLDAEGCVRFTRSEYERALARGDLGFAGLMQIDLSAALAAVRSVEACAVATEAVAFFRTHGSLRRSAAALNNRGYMRLEMGNAAAGILDFWRSMWTNRSNSGHVMGIAIDLNDMSRAFNLAGRPKRARELAQRVLALDPPQPPPYRADAIHNGARALAALGDLAGALRESEAALAIHRDMDAPRERVPLLADVALWHAQLGNLEAARDFAAQALAVDFPDCPVPQCTHFTLARVAQACGDAALAAEQLAAAAAALDHVAAQLQGPDLDRLYAAPWNAAIRDMLSEAPKARSRSTAAPVMLSEAPKARSRSTTAPVMLSEAPKARSRSTTDPVMLSEAPKARSRSTADPVMLSEAPKARSRSTAETSPEP